MTKNKKTCAIFTDTMDMQGLKRLVQEGEHQTLEFKRKANHPEKIIREFVAFANSEGGTLLLGVEDDGGIFGTKEPDGDEYLLMGAVQKWVYPDIEISVSRVPVTSKRAVLIFDIEESNRKPHFVREDDRKRAFVRVRDMSVQASREVRTLMRYENRDSGVRFEFGPRERRLLQYIEVVTRTTVNDTQKQMRIPKRVASGLLITLVRAGLLEIHPTETEDYFTLAEDSFESS